MKSLMWILGGALVGAGAALLYAPMTGDRMRSLMRDKFTRYSNDVSDSVQSKARHMRNKVKGWQHRAGEMVDTANDMMHEMATRREEEPAPVM